MKEETPSKTELISKIEKLESIKKELKARALTEDLLAFNKEILQVEDGNNLVELNSCHEELCEFVMDEKTNKKLILFPRGHLKSTLVTIGYSLQRICKDPTVRVLIANATYSMACSFLGQIKKHLQYNDKIKEFYGDLAKNPAKWSEDMISLENKKGFGKKEATVTAYGIGGNLVSQHYDLIIMDDVVNRDFINTAEQIQKTILFYKDALDLLEPNGKIIVIGCLTGDSKVLMGDGSWKEITKVKKGDVVFSYKDKRLVKQNVLDFIPQGKDTVYEIKTDRHSIKANKRHPFMVLGENGVEWRRVGQLKKDDKVITIARTNHETSKRHFDGRFLRSDFFYFLGYMFGDGWLVKSKSRNYGYAFAKSIYPDRDKKIIDAIKKWFNKDVYETKYGYYRAEDKSGCEYLESIGFKGTAKTKRVPEWMFSMRACYKKAFIDGMIGADGTKNRGEGYRVELANKGLIEDLYWLSLTCGYRPGKILQRTRTIKAPSSPKEVTTTFYSIALTYNTRQACGLNQYNWRWERVASIEKGKEEDVYDLSIDGTQNFIANGYVVHNTRWADNDLYGWIMDETNPEQVYKSFTSLVKQAYKGDLETGENLDVLWPQKFNQDILQVLKREKGPYEFSAQWMNDPVPQEDAKFKIEWMKTVLEDELRAREITYFTMVDPAIGQTKDSDQTAIVTIGVDQFNNWFVVNIILDRILPNEIIQHIFDNFEEYRPAKIGIELTAYQKSLQYALVDAMRARNTFLPIVELKADRSKRERIEGLIPRYANGTIYHLQQCPFRERLEDQLIRYPRGKHDDIIDSLAYGLQIAHQTRKRPIKRRNKYGSDREDSRTSYLY